MAKNIVPSSFKTHLVEQMVESLNEPDPTLYYAFIGDHLTTGSTEDDVVTPTGSPRELRINTYRNMIMAKQLEANDMRLMVPRHNWVSGTVYSEYDDQDVKLYEKNYFVVVDESAYKHVYKCLYNNFGVASTVQPVFSDISYDAALYVVGDDYYETSDGYRWKYMYSIDSTTFSKFATAEYIPVTANTTVENNAQNGTIDVIRIEDGGKNYNNYYSGQFEINDLKVTGDTFLYGLKSDAGTAAGFYGNTIIQLISGTGAGLWSRVNTSYVLEDYGVVIEIANSFVTTPDTTTTFEISPEVKVSSDGTQSVDVVARAIINADSSNSISKIEILNVGSNYTFATAEVLKGTPAAADNSSQGVTISPTDATVRPIIPPTGGHGANSSIELGAQSLGIYVQFNSDEEGVVSPVNSFSQFGILRDPLFANVEIFMTLPDLSGPGSVGTFSPGERFLQIETLRLFDSITITQGNNIIASDTGNVWKDYLKSGDFIYFTDGAATHWISQIEVGGVANNTNLTMEDEPSVSITSGQAYLVKVVSSGKVNFVGTNYITGRDVYNQIQKDLLIIGLDTYATAVVAGTDVSNRLGTETGDVDMSKANQMFRAIGNQTTGGWIENRQIYQGTSLEDSTASAYLHSAYTDGGGNLVLSFTNVLGSFSTGQQILGEVDGVLDANWTKYNPEIDSTSGSIIYLQNNIPVERTENQTEEIRVILEF